MDVHHSSLAQEIDLLVIQWVPERHKKIEMLYPNKTLREELTFEGQLGHELEMEKERKHTAVPRLAIETTEQNIKLIETV